MKICKILSFILTLLTIFSLFGCNSSEQNENTATEAVTDAFENESEKSSEKELDNTNNGQVCETEEKSNEQTNEVASENVSSNDTNTDTVPEDVVTELKKEFISFSNYTSTTVTTRDFKQYPDYAVSFTVPDGYMSSLSLILGTFNTPTDVDYEIRIYKFNGSYKESVAERPLRTEYVDSVMKSYTIYFGKGKMSAGDYLLVLSAPNWEIEEFAPEARMGSIWLPTTLPEKYEKYNFVTYTGGKAIKKGGTMLGGFIHEHYVPATEVEELPTEVEKDPENTAKVIILGGQSNAVGSSSISQLHNKFGEDKYKEYANGYENVKIIYRCTSTGRENLSLSNYSDTFVNVKAGQGYTSSSFGPELGLAEYLNKNYPNETFYIIKYAIGGCSMAGYWNVNKEDKQSGLTNFKETVDLGLSQLKEQGLDPKIIAFLWMQGESDCGSLPGAFNYYDMQVGLVDHIREIYAPNASNKGIAFIDAEISDSGYWNFYMPLNSVKRDIEKLSPINFLIDTNGNGLTTLYENNDPAHYDSDSMIWLGQLYGEELSKILD